VDIRDFTRKSAQPVTEPRFIRNSDPEYVRPEPIIDPLTQRPVLAEKRDGSTSDQAVARGHWIDALKPVTWPKCGEPVTEQDDADTQT
jgi:hypothetical protein